MIGISPAVLATYINSLWGLVSTYIFSHLLTIVTVLLGLLIVSKLLQQKRAPSYTFAWILLLLFLPLVGIPLYFFFGGRKSERLVRHKKHALEVAAQAAGTPTSCIAQSHWSGNSFTILGNGTETYNELCKQIKDAKKSIYIMSYLITTDEIGKEIVRLLAEKARQGVEVKLLLDALGSFGHVFFLTKPLRDAGGKVARFMPVLPFQTKTSANLRNHRKIAIFDGQTSIVGGQNLDTRFLGPNAECPNRFLDFSAIIDGPATESLKRIFISDWCFAAGESPLKYQTILRYHAQEKGNVPVKIIASGPDSQGDPLWEKLVTLVQECREKITIITPYFIPDDVLFHSLIVKAKAGYDVTLVIPLKSNQRLVDFARHYYLRQLQEAGVHILMYTPRMLHAKLFLVDDKIAMMGSANMDLRSFFVNFEIGILLDTPEPLAQLKEWTHTVILPNCTRYENTKQSHSGPNRRILENFSHLFVPLL